MTTQTDAIKLAIEALEQAATSLETISRLAGKTHYVGDDGERVETYMGHHDQVRGYAISRASVAREALAALQGQAQAREGEADEMLRNLGLDPEQYRTDGGAINHLKVKAAIKHPEDYTPQCQHEFAMSASYGGMLCRICGKPDRKSAPQPAHRLANAVLDLMTPDGGDVSDIGAQPEQGERIGLENMLQQWQGDNDVVMSIAAYDELLKLLQSAQPVAQPLPLTDERIAAICLAQTGFDIEGYNLTDYAIMDFARAIESAHGIGGAPNAYGMHIAVNPTIPPGEVHIVVDGKVTGKVTGIGGER